MSAHEGSAWQEHRQRELEQEKRVKEKTRAQTQGMGSRQEKKPFQKVAPASKRTLKAEKELELSRTRDVEYARVRREIIEKLTPDEALLVYEALHEVYGGY
jgi:hypothetical protein